MKINRIQNYNTNFGALIYKPKASQYLATLGQKALAELNVVEKNLSDTKFYDLEIREQPVIRQPNGDKIYSPFNINKSGNYMIIRGKCGGQSVSAKIKFDKKSDMLEVYNDITESETQIMRTGKIVKYLDRYEKENKVTIYNLP